MENFNPNSIGVANGNFFGLPTEVANSEIVLLPIPWDVTVSYNPGTSEGPEAMLDASLQIDLFDINVKNAWELSLGTVPVSEEWRIKGKETREVAKEVISRLEEGESEESLKEMISIVNKASGDLNNYVKQTSNEYLSEGKIVGIVGGDHSVPFGLIQALSEKYEDFGILHVDAHADLRNAYEGFQYSHASIMFNVLKEIPQVKKIVQVGVRDFCEDEYCIMNTDERVESFVDFNMQREIFEGGNWKKICDRIIDALPEKVYLSFDIDGLSPEFCPGTGTPVPGGISFSQAEYLLYSLKKSQKQIIGFDLCEVTSASEWDANVGARVLFKIAQLLSKN